MAIKHGLGTYGNAVGTVTPEDHKLALAGLVVKDTTGKIRPGLFWEGVSTIVSGKSGMSYDVARFNAALTRGVGDGAVLLANDGVVNVVTTPAPGSNSRYDVVYVWQREYALDGTDSEPVIGVEQGTAASSPAVPSLAAFPGAIELARILVPAGVTATNSGTTVTQTAPFTAAAGGVIPFPSKPVMDATVNLPVGSVGAVAGTLYLWNGTAWKESIRPADTGWQTPTLLNSWANYGGSFQTARYRLFDGHVEIEGLIKSGSINKIFTLDAGYRPAGQHLFLGAANGGGLQMYVWPNGDVTAVAYIGGGTNALVSISGIRFAVA